MTSAPQKLRVIKVLHTLFWIFFAGCIFAIPVAARMGRFDCACWASGFMLIELATLAVNGGRCPVTDVAARYTDDRRANFDIYLPLWLARKWPDVLSNAMEPGWAATQRGGLRVPVTSRRGRGRSCGWR
jgi:hypothetical protein